MADPELWIAFFSLLLLEVVLGIDNVVFISILTDKLPAAQQAKARYLGLSLALVTRILLLLSLSWLIGLTAPLFTLPLVDQDVSGRDLILIVGGLFLLGKSTYEIHERLEGGDTEEDAAGGTARFGPVIGQIVLLDIVFSLDSVITAVGMVDELLIMVAAVLVAMVIMLVSAGAISGFVNRHPTVKMLALAFLLIIGASLIAEGFEAGVSKGYIYGPIAFAILVEALNLRYHTVVQRRRARAAGGAPAPDPVHLRPTYVKSAEHPRGVEATRTDPAERATE